VWKAQLTTLRARLSRWNRQEQQIFRQFSADAEVLTTDSNGRILLSRRYRELVGINMEVRFIGMDDTIEIWARENVEMPFVEPEIFSAEIERLMENREENTL
jgi:MraZ protein